MLQSNPAARLDWPSEAEPRPNKREAAIYQALAANVNGDVEEMPLSGLRDWIRRSHDIPVVFDNKALTDAGLPLDLPITLRLSKAPLGEALRFALSESELTYVVANEVLLITSKTEAESMLTTKVYPVLDLVAPAHSVRAGSGYDSLIEIIQINVALSSWDETGGPGSMMAFPSCGALVVSQTAAGHEEVRRLLNALREARNQAEAKE